MHHPHKLNIVFSNLCAPQTCWLRNYWRMLIDSLFINRCLVVWLIVCLLVSLWRIDQLRCYLDFFLIFCLWSRKRFAIIPLINQIVMCSWLRRLYPLFRLWPTHGNNNLGDWNRCLISNPSSICLRTCRILLWIIHSCPLPLSWINHGLWWWKLLLYMSDMKWETWHGVMESQRT